MSVLTRTEWWLCWGSFPDLSWARLRVYSDGTADIFDCDGRPRRFDTEAEAREDLLEDEYGLFDRLNDDDYEELQLKPSELHPPAGVNDDALRPYMFVRRRGSS